jgi:hypothetical protein
MKDARSFIVLLEEDANTGELVLKLNANLLNQMGWAEGDTLVWTDNGDMSFTLTQKENTGLCGKASL